MRSNISQSSVAFLRNCGLCRDEVCTTIDSLGDKGVAESIREACRYLSQMTDGEISSEAFRRMYYRKDAPESQKEPTADELVCRARKYLIRVRKDIEKKYERGEAKADPEETLLLRKAISSPDAMLEG